MSVAPRPPQPAKATASQQSARPIRTGATARAAVSPRVNATLSTPTRRSSLRESSNGSAKDEVSTASSKEVLVASLKKETDDKEELLVRLQNKDQTITSLKSETATLTTALNAAEARLNEMYSDQNRMEDEVQARVEVIEKLRIQARELEREKRDAQRRYNEQTLAFDAERQSFYDNEQHLKSRIQSLTQVRRNLAEPTSPQSTEHPEDDEPEEEMSPPEAPPAPSIDEDNEPAEMTALRLELSTLSVSHASLQNTLQLLQSQLLDLKRVNLELQEENESYNILLREKTLSGQFDIMRHAGNSPAVQEQEDEDEDGDEDESDSEPVGLGVSRDADADGRSLRSTGRSTLDRVSELDELGIDKESDLDDPQPHARSRRRARNSTSSPSSDNARGESLANLPITGPGLDLAAELGRAANKDMLDDNVYTGQSGVITAPSKRGGKKRKGSDKAPAEKSATPGGDNDLPASEMDVLRSEVKSLKDANKALSLYASKIIDRIISQEGFEHVLAIDYDKTFSPTAASQGKPRPSPKTQASTPPAKRKDRPQSFVFRSNSMLGKAVSAEPDRLTTFAPPASPSADSKRSRRSLSFDWRGFSIFGGNEKEPATPNPSLRPLTLRPGLVVGARKLDTAEDEEDRKERERLEATMKLMGIDKPTQREPYPIIRSPPPTDTFASATPRAQSTLSGAAGSIFPFMRSQSSGPSSETSSVVSMGGDGGAGRNTLTTQALEQAEAVSTLAALDAREKVLSEELARGKGSGFTELNPRASLGEEWRSKRGRVSTGSASTVWSAGLKEDVDEVAVTEPRHDLLEDNIDTPTA